MPTQAMIVLATPDLEEATHIAALGFEVPNDDVLRNDVKDHLCGDLVYAAYENNRLVAFATFCFLDHVLWLSGLMIRPDCQSTGLVKQIVDMARMKGHERSGKVFTHFAYSTQNPRMWAASKKAVENQHPNPDADFPAELSAVADLVFPHVEISSLQHRTFYSRQIYGAKPIHRNKHIQAWWDSICCFENLDAIFCIGTLPQSSS